MEFEQSPNSVNNHVKTWSVWHLEQKRRHRPTRCCSVSAELLRAVLWLFISCPKPHAFFSSASPEHAERSKYYTRASDHCRRLSTCGYCHRASGHGLRLFYSTTQARSWLTCTLICNKVTLTACRLLQVYSFVSVWSARMSVFFRPLRLCRRSRICLFHLAQVCNHRSHLIFRHHLEIWILRWQLPFLKICGVCFFRFRCANLVVVRRGLLLRVSPTDTSSGRRLFSCASVTTSKCMKNATAGMMRLGFRRPRGRHQVAPSRLVVIVAVERASGRASHVRDAFVILFP